MANASRIGIIGAGNVGGNLGIRLSNSGFPLMFGVRKGERPAALDACAKDARAGTIEETAAWADVLFFALPANAMVDVVRSLGKSVAGKVVVDCSNPMSWKDGPVWAPPAEGSIAAAVAKSSPDARVVKGFNTFGAEFHKDPQVHGSGATVFLAGDDAAAKKTVIEIASQAGFQPVDAGPLRNAAVLKNTAMLWIHLATVGGQGRNFVLQVTKR